jgi:hypothetical protein
VMNEPEQESMALAQARQRWIDASDQYRREVTLATDPLKTFEQRMALVDATRHAELIARITEARNAYDEALKAEGRNAPHRK